MNDEQKALGADIAAGPSTIPSLNRVQEDDDDAFQFVRSCDVQVATTVRVAARASKYGVDEIIMIARIGDEWCEFRCTTTWTDADEDWIDLDESEVA